MRTTSCRQLFKQVHNSITPAKNIQQLLKPGLTIPRRTPLGNDVRGNVGGHRPSPQPPSARAGVLAPGNVRPAQRACAAGSGVGLACSSREHTRRHTHHRRSCSHCRTPRPARRVCSPSLAAHTSLFGRGQWQRPRRHPRQCSPWVAPGCQISAADAIAPTWGRVLPPPRAARASRMQSSQPMRLCVLRPVFSSEVRTGARYMGVWLCCGVLHVGGAMDVCVTQRAESIGINRSAQM